MYDMMYYCHNLHFLAASYSMEGNFGHAKQAAVRHSWNSATLPLAAIGSYALE